MPARGPRRPWGRPAGRSRREGWSPRLQPPAEAPGADLFAVLAGSGGRCCRRRSSTRSCPAGSARPARSAAACMKCSWRPVELQQHVGDWRRSPGGREPSRSSRPRRRRTRPRGWAARRGPAARARGPSPGASPMMWATMSRTRPRPQPHLGHLVLVQALQRLVERLVLAGGLVSAARPWVGPPRHRPPRSPRSLVHPRPDLLVEVFEGVGCEARGLADRDDLALVGLDGGDGSGILAAMSRGIVTTPC